MFCNVPLWKRHGIAIGFFFLALLLIFPFTPAHAQATDVTIGYQVVKVTGPGGGDRWIIYLKVINNGDNHVNQVWVRASSSVSGTSNIGDPQGWASATTTDSDGVIRGAIWACMDPSKTVAPHSTKTGFTWEVESKDPPKLVFGVVNYQEGYGETAPVTKVVVQTENQNCEDPEEHGFQRGGSADGYDFSIIPDQYFQFEDCVLAVGDEAGTPDFPFMAWLQTPVLDLAEESEPSIQFTSLFISNGAGVGFMHASPDGGMTWFPILDIGFDCLPETPCYDSVRQIIPLPGLAGAENAIIRWEFQWSPGETKIPMYASWILDDIVILGDSPPTPSFTPLPGTGSRIALAAPSPNPFTYGTEFSFRLPQAGPVRLQVFDLRGRLVRTLVDSRLNTGPHLIRWNGRDGTGQRAAAGIYLVRLEQGGLFVTRKVVLMD